MNEKELTYGGTIKQPFPKLEDIEWVMVDSPCWLESERIVITYKDKDYTVYPNTKEKNISSFSWLKAVENLHKNSQDFKVKWQLKQTDQHADIKAEYENDEIKSLKKAKLEIEAMLNKKG